MTTLEALRLPISDQLTIPVYFNQAEEVVPPTRFSRRGMRGEQLFGAFEDPGQCTPPSKCRIAEPILVSFRRLEDDTAIHFVVLDRFVFQYMLDTAETFQNTLYLGGPPGGNFGHRTRLEIHLIPSVEAIEMVSRIQSLVACIRIAFS